MKKLVITLSSCVAIACLLLVDFSSIANAMEINDGSGWVANCADHSEVSCTLECYHCQALFTAPYTVSGPISKITGSCPKCGHDKAGEPIINGSTTILP